MNAMWVKILSGVVLGLAIGYVNDRSTLLWFGRMFRQGLSHVRPVVLLLSVGFYLAKYLFFSLMAYGVVVLFQAYGGSRSRADLVPFLLALAGGLLGFQLARMALMVLRPRQYLGQRLG